MWYTVLGCSEEFWCGQVDTHISYEDFCARNRYQVQVQVITLHGICGMLLLKPAPDACLWHTTPRGLNQWETKWHIAKYFLITMLYELLLCQFLLTCTTLISRILNVRLPLRDTLPWNVALPLTTISIAFWVIESLTFRSFLSPIHATPLLKLYNQSPHVNVSEFN